MTALERQIELINKKYGTGTLMRGNQGAVVDSVDVIDSGSMRLNIALGVGGYPRGRIVEIYGPESSGKTTLTLHAIAECQKNGGEAVFIDAEHALDRPYAQALGVDMDRLVINQPKSGEQALEVANQLVSSGAVDLVVIDSVSALTPQAEIDGEVGDYHVGLQARLMSQALRMMASSISGTGTCVIFLNQIRLKIGVMFGSPETTSGGNALKFYASQRLDIRRIGSTKGTTARGHKELVSNKVRVRVVKNKVAPPFRQAEFEIRFGTGIDRAAELLDLAVEYDIVDKAGSWYSFGEERLGQGQDNARAFLVDSPDIMEQIKAQVWEALYDEGTLHKGG